MFSLSSLFYFLISGAFSIFRLVYSLPFMLLGLLFYVLALGSRIVKQKCQNSDIYPKFLPYGLGLIFLVLSVTVGGSSGLSRGHIKGSRWNFDDAKSEPLQVFLGCDVPGPVGAPGVSCSLAEDKNIYSGRVADGNLTFPECLIPETIYVLVGKGEKPVASKRKNKNGEWVHVYGCGDVMWSYICRNLACRKLHAGVHKCLRKVCPDCYEKYRASS